MPAFTIGKPVPITEIPQAAVCGRRGQFDEVYEQIASLKRGSSLPISFADSKSALAGRAALRKVAKREGEFISSAWGEDKKSFFFWLEPKA